MKLECFAPPGSGWPSKDGRYKWFVDLDSNMYHSGENIYDAEYVLFVEDTDHNGLGEMYLVYDTDGDGNLAEYEPWPPTNYTDFEVTDSNVGSWRIVAPNQIEMYISWASIGDPSAYCLTWATDQQNPNLDQGPTTDHVDEEVPIKIHDVAAVSQTPNATDVIRGSSVTIEVIIENQGMQNESFEVSCYFNMSIIGSLNITNLPVNQNTTLYFEWDTTGVPPGTYVIEAWADSNSAIAEIDEVDNWCTSPATVTVQEVLIQYYLTVNSPYGFESGEGWYDNATNAYAALDTGTIDHGNGTRRVFTNWSEDASGTNYASSDPIYMNQNKTATAIWKTQQNLTVVSPYGTTGGEGWYDSGDTAYATLDTDLVDHGNGTRRLFISWSGDASGSNYSQSNPILMDAPKTATANWKTQYYLTITTTLGGTTNPPNSTWYDSGTTASVTAIPDADYVFDHWELDSVTVGSANPYGVYMDTTHTLHAVFVYSPPQPTYYLTVETDPAAVTTIPGEGWYNEDDNVPLTAPNYVTVATDARYKFTYWDVDGVPQGAGVNPITIHMDANHTATAHYVLQFYLTVKTSPSGVAAIPGEGWYDQSSNVSLVAPPVVGYDFLYWDVDGASQGSQVASILVSMNSPHVATAYYTQEQVVVGGFTTSINSSLLDGWIGLNIVIAIAVFTFALWIKRQED